MANTGFAVVIAATDKATATIERINKELRGLAAPVTRLGTSLHKLSDVSGITEVGRGLRFAGERMLGMGRSALMAIGPVGALGGALSAAGVVHLATQWSTFGQQLTINAARIGISTTRLQTLQGAARLAGSSSEAMTSGLRNLQDVLTDTAGGRNMEALTYFQGLGVAFADSSGKARRAADVLPELADAISRIQDPTLRARLATQMFGSAGEELLPLLARGSRAIAELEEKTRQLGIQSEQQVRQATESAEAHNRLTQAFTNLGNTLSATVEPALEPVLTQLTQWASGPDAKKRVEDLGTALKNIDWKKIGQDIDGASSSIGGAVKNTIGWEHAIELLGAQAVIQALGLGKIEAVLLRLVAIQLPAWLLALVTKNPVVAGAVLMGAAGAAADQAGGHAWSEGEQTPLGGGFRDRPSMDQYMKDHPPATGPNAPRGFRNNNPLNLEFRPGQGASGSDGRFGIYPTMEAGIAAAARQLRRYGTQGDNTIRRIISRWAPPGENDTEGYIRNVSQQMGIKDNQVLDLNDRATLARLISAMSRQENSLEPDSSDVFRGVDTALGGPGGTTPRVAPGLAAQPQNGRVDVRVTVAGPPGTAAHATSSGIATVAPPRVERAMPGAGAGVQ